MGTATPSLTVDVPVLIVGAGPTGLLQAHCFATLGIQCLRYFVNLALIREVSESSGSPREDAYWVNFVTSLSGERFGKLEYERMDPGVLVATPEMIHNIPQPILEQYFTDGLKTSDLVEIKKGVSFVSLHQDLEHGTVLSTVEERASGQRFNIRSRHVVACDGRKSKVRDFLGIECDGEDSIESMMTIHFNADLRPVIGEYVGILHWIFDPEVSGFIIGYDLSGDLVLIHNFDPEKHPVEQWDESRCRTIVDKAIGQKVAYDILSFRPWILSRKIAKSYRLGNVFLAGDAAHSFPPNAGLGLNSGIADVHNLAYKIAAVHNGWATDKLLESYHLERKPVAEVNAKQSVKNGVQIFGLLKALGTAGIENPAEARENLFRTIWDPEKHDEIQRQIEEQREHFDNLELHIGYVYGSLKAPSNASNFTPEYVPGARVPHSWIRLLSNTKLSLPPIDVSYISELSTDEIECRHTSSLDLCERDGFTVIAGRDSIWTAKLSDLQRQAAVNLPPMYSRQLNVDFEMINTAYANEWVNRMGLNQGCVVVVRPDQHILCLLAEEDPASALLNAVRMHLGVI